MPRPLLALACLLALAVAGCGGGGDGGDKAPDRPQVGVKGDEEEATTDLGFPTFATKNTTRVGGGDSVANAAAVARAVYPGTRPKAVALVDSDDWQGGVAAAALYAQPIGAPVLLTDGDDLPDASRDALEALAPTGSKEAGNAQVIRIGEGVAEPKDLKTTDVAGKSPAEVAAQVDAVLSEARGRTTDHVMVVGTEKPEFAVPAAGYAAKSGEPVLFVEQNAIPAATKAALERHQQPKIFILGPEAAVSKKVETDLRRLGTVERVVGIDDPVAASIAFAKFVSRGKTFGWEVTDPGHGLVFVNRERPLDAVAAAPLSGSGTYGPVLFHAGGARLDTLIDGYLQDIRPGYRKNPVRGVYNHGWIIGDEKAMPIATQSRIDALLEIALVDTEATNAPTS